ncbi:YdeI/OmpD-associated family protein [Acrocarpospora corrugata]|uniref:YdeI/OmpD-associated family protein n=1 Tax=Acrocarpospora corrugata TaxID=35763 RepID=UPI001C3FB1BB|nr:YdeI/OmpD-associated family protein [Acrocarpospora corrugata]
MVANHDAQTELWVGYYKVSTGKPSITWPESVDQALCFGWIDGVRKSVDDDSYKIRFTPRKARSIWSAVNIARFQELVESGLVHPKGQEVFDQRTADRSVVYSYEQGQAAELPAEYEEKFRAEPAAWEWFQGQAPYYRRAATHWVTSAKREETRLKRLTQLISDSAEGRRVAVLTPPGKK